MKKYFLLIAVFLGMQANFAQSLCSYEIVDNLKSCMTGNGVVFGIIYTGNNSIYIVGKGSPAPGRIQSCIAQYNTAATDCPDAPVIIDNPKGQQL